MVGPRTPGPGWSFELLLATLAALLFAVVFLLPQFHLNLGWHMSHGGKAVHSKSL
jgi:hypothetical protein